MNQLKDIFNTQFFVILGVVLLLVTCLVLYVEQKFKSYDHKLSSMLSLVSSLAEEFELSKQSNPNISVPNQSSIAVEKLSNDLEESQLIDVSDNSDSESDSESDSDDELGENESNTLDTDSNSEDESVDENENKIISAIDILDTHNENELFTIKKLEANDIIDLEPEHLEELDELNRVEELGEVDDLEEMDDLDEMDDLEDLEELKDEVLDYKKLPVAKLKEIALEKELITPENNKMKKAELLKLLEDN